MLNGVSHLTYVSSSVTLHRTVFNAMVKDILIVFCKIVLIEDSHYYDIWFIIWYSSIYYNWVTSQDSDIFHLNFLLISENILLEFYSTPYIDVQIGTFTNEGRYHLSPANVDNTKILPYAGIEPTKE